ncbi:DUF2576 domain-containing protein [Bacillus thuringiensis]|nr:DUF2576 domain-containing protein [Bacillus thuringiensis]
MMLSLPEKVLYFVKRKRRNNHDTCRRSGSYLDCNRIICSRYESS